MRAAAAGGRSTVASSRSRRRGGENRRAVQDGRCARLARRPRVHTLPARSIHSGSRALVGETRWVERRRSRLNPVIGFELVLQRGQTLLKRGHVGKSLEFLTVVGVVDGEDIFPGVVVEARLELQLLCGARPEPDHGYPSRVPAALKCPKAETGNARASRCEGPPR